MQTKAACNCPLGACHSTGICNHFEKRDFPCHWRRRTGTSAQNIPLKIAFNVAFKTIFGSGKMWCKGRPEQCIVTVTQNQTLYHLMKISRCVKTHQDNQTAPQASLHMVTEVKIFLLCALPHNNHLYSQFSPFSPKDLQEKKECDSHPIIKPTADLYSDLLITFPSSSDGFQTAFRKVHSACAFLILEQTSALVPPDSSCVIKSTPHFC